MIEPIRSPLRPLVALLVAIAPLLLSGQTKREKKVGTRVEAPAAHCDTLPWKLVWYDEFNGTELDRTKWRTWFPYTDDGGDRGWSTRLMGNSNTIFRDELVTVRDGVLRLGVRAQPGEWYGHRKEHEGAMIHSLDHGRFAHGRFEVRCRIPRGAGLWPAFWGFGGETEIDVFEFCGEKPRVLKAALHRWGRPKFSNNGKHRSVDLSKDFHVYAVEWEGDAVSWYLDGQLIHQRTRYVDDRGRPLPPCDRPAGEHHTAPYFPRENDGINIILDLAVSAPKDFCKGPKKPKPWPEGTALEVDYVRVYQRGR